MALSFAKQPAVESLSGLPEGDWSTWAAAHRPPARFLSVWSGRAVHGFDSPLRLGGVVAQPAEVVLGIRGWEDAFEETLTLSGYDRQVPSVLFEIEKIVRMLLHQSGLAFEILASPAVLFDDDFPARRVVESAVTTGILHHYRDVARGLLARLKESRGQGATGRDVLDMARNALTGRGLIDGQVAFDLWALVGEYGASELDGLLGEVDESEPVEAQWLDEVSAHVDELLDALRPEDAKLPDRPKDYDWLNDLVVSLRTG